MIKKGKLTQISVEVRNLSSENIKSARTQKPQSVEIIDFSLLPFSKNDSQNENANQKSEFIENMQESCLLQICLKINEMSIDSKIQPKNKSSIDKSIQEIKKELEVASNWLINLEKKDFFEFHSKIVIVLDFLEIFLTKKLKTDFVSNFILEVYEFLVVLSNLICFHEIVDTILLEKISSTISLCINEFSKDVQTGDNICLLFYSALNIFLPATNSKIDWKKSITFEKSAILNIEKCFNKIKSTFQNQAKVEKNSILHFMSSLFGIELLFQILFKTLCFMEESTPNFSQLLALTLDFVEEFFTKNSLSSEVNKLFIKNTLKFIQKCFNLSDDFAFFHSSRIVQIILNNISKSSDNFQALYQFLIKFIRINLESRKDEELVKSWFGSMELMSNFKLLYNSTVKPKVEYLDNQSIKVSRDKSSRLNENSKLIFEFEIISLKNVKKWSLLKQFFKLFISITKARSFHSSLFDQEITSIADHIFSHGNFFLNLNEEVQNIIIDFLEMYVSKLFLYDKRQLISIRNRFLDFFVTNDLPISQTISLFLKNCKFISKEDESFRLSKRDSNGTFAENFNLESNAKMESSISNEHRFSFADDDISCLEKMNPLIGFNINCDKFTFSINDSSRKRIKRFNFCSSADNLNQVEFQQSGEKQIKHSESIVESPEVQTITK